MPKISVIIPCYNCSDTIEECVGSVMKQTFLDYEIIIINDGSSDGSSTILNKFGQDIKVIHQKNAGAAQARNKGVEIARGELIAFLDADDRWHPEKLELQLAEIEKGYDMVHCPAKNIGNLGKWNPPNTQHVDIPSYKYLEALFLGNLIVTSSVLVKKKCVEKVGRFDSKFRNCQDWDLWVRIAKYFKITCVNKKLVEYRIGINSLSSSSDRVLSAGLSVLKRNKHLLPLDKKEQVYKDATYEMYLNGCWRQLRANDKLKAFKYLLHALSIHPAKKNGWIWAARIFLG